MASRKSVRYLSAAGFSAQALNALFERLVIRLTKPGSSAPPVVSGAAAYVCSEASMTIPTLLMIRGQPHRRGGLGPGAPAGPLWMSVSRRCSCKDGTVVGSSSYLNVDPPNRRLEIGNTWFSASVRRTGVNTESKLLMLSHAFDELGCIAVEFRTHFFNSTSRAASTSLVANVQSRHFGILAIVLRRT